MMSTIKAEFRKLLSVRSTYVVTALSLALVIFYAFYIQGWRLAAPELQSPDKLTGDVFGAVQAVTFFGGIIAVLLMSHEYRYNTIMYTLTSSNSRSKVLFAKILAISAFAIVFAILIGTISPIASYIGVHAHGHSLVPQTLDFGELIWRSLFYGWGYAMAGLLFVTLIRSQVGSIAALFVVPGILEQLLTLLLKENSRYLPFSTLDRVLNSDPKLIPTQAALVYGAYLVGGWIITWILFMKRDAN